MPWYAVCLYVIIAAPSESVAVQAAYANYRAQTAAFHLGLAPLRIDGTG